MLQMLYKECSLWVRHVFTRFTSSLLFWKRFSSTQTQSKTYYAFPMHSALVFRALIQRFAFIFRFRLLLHHYIHKAFKCYINEHLLSNILTINTNQYFPSFTRMQRKTKKNIYKSYVLLWLQIERTSLCSLRKWWSIMRSQTQIKLAFYSLSTFSTNNPFPSN